MIPDRELLERYAKLRDEDAFTALVDRHLPLVYSVALRHVQNREIAKELAQQVFLDLARKAPELRQVRVLGGWLYQHTVFLSSTARRSEQRRKAMETIMDDAIERQEPGNALNEAVLAAMQDLNQSDRDALILRFLESRSIKEVGYVLECTDEAARKRIDRAAERLREALRSKGIASSSGMIGSALVAGVMAVPQGLASAIAATVVAASPLTSVVTVSLFEFMTTKFKTALVTGLLTIGVSAPVLMQQKINRLETQVTQLQSRKNEVRQVGEDARAISAPSSPAPPRGSAPLVWSDVQADDHGQYIANLRKIGCPEETIRAIVAARVRSEFKERRKNTPAFTEPIEFWKTGIQLRQEAGERLKGLDQQFAAEERALLTSLFGPDIEHTIPRPEYRRVDLDNELLNVAVDPSKLEQLKQMRFQIEGFFDAHILPRTNIKGSPGFNDKDREDYAAFRKMERDLMATLLTPEELQNVELHTRHLPDWLRFTYAGFEFSEVEFRAMYEAFKPYEITLDPYYFGGSEALLADWMEVKRKLGQHIRDLIGEERFAQGANKRREENARVMSSLGN